MLPSKLALSASTAADDTYDEHRGTSKGVQTTVYKTKDTSNLENQQSEAEESKRHKTG